MAQITRPTLFHRKSHVNRNDDEELETFASVPAVGPRVSNDRSSSSSSFEEKDSEQSKRPDPSLDPGPPPDGGFKAWLQVLGAFFLNFNTWYQINIFSAMASQSLTTIEADSLRAGVLSIHLEPSKTIMLPVPPSQLPSQQSPGSVQSKVSSC